MRRDAADFAKDTDPLLLRLAGMLRRMAVTVTAKALWQVVGFKQLDGTTETRQAEPFTGIGFFSRPPSSGKPEAVVGFVGGDRNPTVIATRDEATRAAVAGGLQEDETMAFNSKAVVYIKADGTIEARTASGVAVQLCTLADIQALITMLKGAGAGAATAIPAAIAALYSTDLSTYIAGPMVGKSLGTQKLKGE